MVDLPRKRKHSPFHHDREFVYTLPSGEIIIITPNKCGRGLVSLPEGTGVEVRKIPKPIDPSTICPQNE